MKHLALPILMAVTFFGSVPANAEISRFETAKDQLALDAAKDLQAWSQFTGHGGDCQASLDELPAHFVKTFKSIQKAAFGRSDLIQVQSSADCDATSDALQKTIYFRPDFILRVETKFPQTYTLVEAFLIAHEVAHFVNDYYTVRSSDGLTPLHHIPLLRKDMMDLTSGEFMTMTPEQQIDQLRAYMTLASAAHAEVDVTGLLILRSMGQNAVLPAIHLLKFIRDSISGDEQSAEFSKSDLTERIEVLTSSF